MKLYPGKTLSMPNWAGTIFFRFGGVVHFANGVALSSQDVMKHTIESSVFDVREICLAEYFFQKWILEKHLLVNDPNDLSPKEYVWFEETPKSLKFILGYVVGYSKTDLSVSTENGVKVIDPTVIRVIGTNFYFDPS